MIVGIENEVHTFAQTICFEQTRLVVWYQKRIVVDDSRMRSLRHETNEKNGGASKQPKGERARVRECDGVGEREKGKSSKIPACMHACAATRWCAANRVGMRHPPVHLPPMLGRALYSINLRATQRAASRNALPRITATELALGSPLAQF